MKKIICAAVATICFFWLLGLAGSLELDRLGFSEVVAQGIPASAILLICTKIGGFIEE